MFFVLTVSQSPCSTVYGGSIVLTSTVAVATLIGGTSGFLGGKLDLAVQRFGGVELEVPRRGPMRAGVHQSVQMVRPLRKCQRD